MTKSRGIGRGGARANAGRKSADGAEVVAVITAYLDQDTLDLVREFGEGNDALGVRLMARELLRLRKAAKGIVSTKHAPVAPAPTNALQARNPLLRQRKVEEDDGPRPLLKGQIKDWD